VTIADGSAESGEANVSESQEEVRKREKVQQQLDEALADSFPASDPVSIVTSNEEEDWGTEAKAPAAPEPGAGKSA
jgi:hypothetical protein